MKEPNAAHGYTEGIKCKKCGGDVIMFTPDLDICQKCGVTYEPEASMTEQEIKAYLNYEDVQKELEQAKGLIKALIPIAEDRLFSVSVNELTSVEDVIRKCKQFLK